MNTEIRNPQGEKLDYAFHEGGSGASALVIIGHGVTGNKDRPWDIALSEALSAAGFHALRFSFAGNGDSEGEFHDSTITKEVGDLGAVIDAATDAGYSNIVYAGHSMGGAVGVLRTSTDDRIQYLISLAGMVHTAKFAEVEFGEETLDQGFMWEDEDCPLSSTFVKDMNSIGSVLDKASSIEVPWLLIHGTGDDVVPIEESREIFAAANEPKEFIELPDVDHVFNDAGLQPMIDAVTSWLGDMV
ncbi:MAG: alpha/beta fold hydrolase [Verrucomicrobiota bacterium]